MSTLDSYLFIAATTVGHDFARRTPDPATERRRTRAGLAISAVLASCGALMFDSAVQVWHDIGTVVTSTLLLPVLAVHLPPRLRPSQMGAVASMVCAAVTASWWIVAATESGYPLGVEPMFPAFAMSVLCLATDLLLARRP
jgi:Na+/proline symporter